MRENPRAGGPKGSVDKKTRSRLGDNWLCQGNPRVGQLCLQVVLLAPGISGALLVASVCLHIALTLPFVTYGHR